MPGIGRKSAERILAETGVEMEHFQNESRFSSWAGLVPECKESAGKKMSTRIRKGNKYLKATLVECARAGIRNKQSYLYSRYQRIAARRGGKRALIVINIVFFQSCLKSLGCFKWLNMITCSIGYHCRNWVFAYPVCC